MVYLRTEQRVNGGTARKDDERETNDCADNEAELHHITEQRRPKIHQHVADNFMIIECYVAEETYLQHTNRPVHLQQQQHNNNNNNTCSMALCLGLPG